MTLWLLGRALYLWRARKGGVADFFTWPTVALAVLALACDVWTGYLLHMNAAIEREMALKAHYRESRRHFVLPQDFQYGELRIPKGSLIDRYDPYDNGTPEPLGLRGLRTVRFPHPVQVAGVWAVAMQAHPGRLELAHDQNIGPVVHHGGGRLDSWVVDTSRPTLDCRKGEVALFHVPLIDYDIQTEFGKPGPDGPAARFKPSQWRVTGCSQGPIEVAPAYTGPAPESAQAPVWTVP
ncbi:hypothetical protein GCM10027082_09040 [Comamonas humi]